jgi:hypothetical protein
MNCEPKLRRGVVTDDGGKDVLGDLEGQLPPFEPEMFDEFLGVSYDPGDYQHHSLSRRLRNARHGRPVRTDRRFWRARVGATGVVLCAAAEAADRGNVCESLEGAEMSNEPEPVALRR